MKYKYLKFLKHLDKKVKYPKLLTVGTDCSGIEAPISALKHLKIPFDHIFSCDNDPDVKISHDANYNPKIYFTDITTRNHKKLPHIDLYVAGFPCQSFSLLGKRAGFNDPIKGTIFFECFETIKACKPKIFILENVKGLINHDSGNTFEIIINTLKTLKNYNIYYDIYNTLDYGLPQNRERLYIVGLNREYFNKYNKPETIPLELYVTDIINDSITNNSSYGELTPHKINILKDLKKTKKIDNLNNPWCVNLNVSSYLRTNPMYDICPCLLAGSGGNCIYYLTSIRRRLTPQEYLRLQGFSDEFKQAVSDSKLYKQIGNSMSTNVLCFIYQEIFRAMK